MEEKSEDKIPATSEAGSPKPQPLQEEISQHFPADSDAPQPQTTNLEHQTSDMEVHKHPHHVTHKKKWGEYLLEFLMLFLAVFLGFLAENQREHLVEHQREKDFMVSLLKDLQADTANLNQMATGFSMAKNHIDSLIPLIEKYEDLDKNAFKIYRHVVWLHNYYKFRYSDRTIDQLKNSGNFRLVRKKEVSDSIIYYDAFVRNYVGNMQQEYILEYFMKVNNASTTIFKTNVFRKWFETGQDNSEVDIGSPPYFLSRDRTQVNRTINELDEYSVAIGWFIMNIRKAALMSRQLNDLIKKEYHLE